MSDNNELGQSVRSRANSEDEMGKDAGGRGAGKNRRPSEKLLTHPRNSPPNLLAAEYFALPSDFADFLHPSSVFFGTSRVPGDGCAASELGAEYFWPSLVEMLGLPAAPVNELVLLWWDGVTLRQEVVADWRLFCATGEEL